MKDLFSTNGHVYRVMTFIYRILVINFLWCVLSLPIVTAGASTTALYYCIGKMIRNEDLNEVRDFLKSFKKNFKQATVVWLILCFFFVAFYFNLNYAPSLGTVGNIIFVIQIPILLQVVMMTLIIFPILSRYECKTKELFKFGIILSNKYIIKMIMCIAVVVGIGFLSFKFLPLLIFGAMGLVSYCIYGMLYPILEKYGASEEAVEGEEEIQA